MATKPDLPPIVYPESLPISERHDELLAAIRDHQVVVVAGETGSGKSTQLPKLCLELGRGADRLIGHTQPRRVAARTIAERIAEELGTELGTVVGYTVRFTDRVGEGTYLKVMTDGILLSELRRDRMLSRYDTLIIDEAHERSLNIDFLLGYIAQLLPRRLDLKVIITSATIDTARFSEHFGGAPIVEVTGRSYPVEVRHRPFGEEPDDDRDQVQAVCDAVDELTAEGPGDVLVFLSGEREIHDTADALRALDRPHTEVLPLYARLSAAEQHRIFEPHRGRRIVLSTNVAETSLTVPGVRYVVDAGSARISRYSTRLKVQRLPIEPVSQASADQRAGRCGRVAPGVCVRLYSAEDLAGRPPYTEPEILRTNLASVILQMTSLGLGDVAAFPFLDPPDHRAVRDGVALLEELGAIAPDQPADRRRLTKVGRRLAELPVDPRLGRMVLEAERHGCVREVLVIAAALSIQDPRERPADKQAAADEAHRRFQTDGSDFLALVRLWDHLRERQRDLSSSQFRKLCRAEFLNYLRVREWQDLYRQLSRAATTVGVAHGTEAGHPDRVHQALLAGLLSQMGMRDGTTREYHGARGSKFAIVPRSAVARALPRWVMAAELVETNRLWARVVAEVRPEWAEQLAGPLAKRSVGEPRWDARRGGAVATERVMLYGLPIVSGRTIAYDRVDPAAAREMFIRHALVEGDWHTRHRFVADNRETLAAISDLAQRTRRGELVDAEAVFRFYDQRVGPGVVSSRHFDQWWKVQRATNPDLLTMSLEALTAGGRRATSASDFPDSWAQGRLTFPVTYRFDPGDPADGVTVHIPLDVLNQVTADGFDWQVPGFRDQLVEELVRSLPKAVRRELVPIAERAQQVAARVVAGEGCIVDALAPIVSELAGRRVDPSEFDVSRVPAHLRMNFVVIDPSGRTLAAGKDVDALRRRLAVHARAAIADTAPSIERRGITAWDFGELPRSIETMRGGNPVRGYPALLDDGDSVAIRVFSTEAIQARAMRGGVRRLLLLSLSLSRSTAERELGNQVKLAIAAADMSLPALIDDCFVATADHLVGTNPPVWDGVAFDELRARARREASPLLRTTLRGAGEVVVAAAVVRARLARLVVPALQPSVADARAQLDRLVRPGFVTAAGASRVLDVLRYVHGIERRLEKLPENPGRDRQRIAEVSPLESEYRQRVEALSPSAVTAEVLDVGWMLEELRVSLFAQSLGTARPVSTKRLRALISQV